MPTSKPSVVHIAAISDTPRIPDKADKVMSLMTLTPEAVCSRLSREQTEGKGGLKGRRSDWNFIEQIHRFGISAILRRYHRIDRRMRSRVTRVSVREGVSY